MSSHIAERQVYRTSPPCRIKIKRVLQSTGERENEQDGRAVPGASSQSPPQAGTGVLGEVQQCRRHRSLQSTSRNSQVLTEHGKEAVKNGTGG